jgi:peptide-methionine (S)-S-oxide reductase
MQLLKRWTAWFALACCVVSGSVYAQQKAGGAPATAQATFAGGCFWCVEEAFDALPGVISTTSGFMGGKTKNPTYQSVVSGATGHAEVVQVQYDPRKVSYEKLLEVFWRNIDPTDPDGQFCDKGSQYRSAIFYQGEEQRRLAVASKASVEKSKPFKQPVVTEVTGAGEFYPAEEYHQDFYKKNPLRYKVYKTGCGREARLHALWGRSGG